MGGGVRGILFVIQENVPSICVSYVILDLCIAASLGSIAILEMLLFSTALDYTESIDRYLSSN